MKRIKTFNEACKKLGLDSKNIPDVSMLSKDYAKAVIAYFKLIIITEALNDGWKPNWMDYNEYKYYPYFVASASGFSFCDCGNSHTISHVSSRLVFKSKELAEFAGRHFLKLYLDHIMFSK